MKLNTITKTKRKEIKNGNTTIIETEKTIFVEPVHVKTAYYIKEKDND